MPLAAKSSTLPHSPKANDLQLLAQNPTIRAAQGSRPPAGKTLRLKNFDSIMRRKVVSQTG